MRRLLPHPILSAGVVLMWLLLNRFSLGHLILGAAISIVAGLALSAIEPETVRVRRPLLLLKLLGVFALDVLRSNIAVAGLILKGTRAPAHHAAFIEMKLQLTHPVALAFLAVIITGTPGSAWLEHDTDSGVLLVHVFDVVDEEAWVRQIRDRYEKLLLEIFE